VTLPDFLVIGAYKAGTTSLHEYLRSHPQIFVPERKEPSFFAFDQVGDPEAERRLNPVWSMAIHDLATYEELFAPARPDQVVGEVSPEYLKNHAAPAAIAARLDEVKLVALLRDPAERAYSDFLMYTRDGQEDTEDFAVALDRQDERRAAGMATGQYVVTGFYGEQLSRYYARFPPDRIKVVLSEDLRADRDGVLADVFAFLGVNPSFRVAAEELNRSGVPVNGAVRAAYVVRRRLAPLLGSVVPQRMKRRVDALLQQGLERPDPPPEPMARLRDIYRDDIAVLERLIGRDLSAWRDAGRGAARACCGPCTLIPGNL
jgi:hypothetical protein